MGKKRMSFLLVAAIIVGIFGMGGCRSPLPPAMYYQGAVSNNYTAVYQGSGGTVEIDGQEVQLTWQDTSQLEQVGELSEVVDEFTTPGKEFATNYTAASVGAPVYRVYIEGTEWLMIEVEETNQNSTEKWTSLVQRYFGEWGK